jgi:hypothetical protein
MGCQAASTTKPTKVTKGTKLARRPAPFLLFFVTFVHFVPFVPFVVEFRRSTDRQPTEANATCARDWLRAFAR